MLCRGQAWPESASHPVWKKGRLRGILLVRKQICYFVVQLLNNCMNTDYDLPLKNLNIAKSTPVELGSKNIDGIEPLVKYNFLTGDCF